MTYDAVIVPGGGVRAGGELPPWVKIRFDRAIERSGEAPIVCLSAGTGHRPNPLDQTGRAIFEAVTAPHESASQYFEQAIRHRTDSSDRYDIGEC